MLKVNLRRLALVAAFGALAMLVTSAIKSAPAPEPAPAQVLEKREMYQATAMGTSTQLGRNASVNIYINEYSTPEDQQILITAFNAKGMEGVTNALSKMPAKGRLAITGTIGYDINYIRQWPTADGRKIRVVTDRPLRFGEVWSDSRSSDYNLSALELNISNEKGKSTGMLLPACQFKINKEKELEIENFQNPWKLVNIMDR